MNSLWLIIRNDWRESVRSPIWHRRAVINALMVLMFVYLAANFLALGMVMDNILMAIPMDEVTYKSHGISWVLQRLNRLLLYYIMLDFTVRYFMQKLPALSIRPLLHLPIKRSQLANFMLVKSIWNPFNLFHFLLFIPFTIEVFSNLPFASALGWSAGFFLLIYTNNFLLLLVKRTSEINSGIYIGLLVVVFAIFILGWFDIVDFMALSGRLFDILFQHPWTAAIPLIFISIAYYSNFRFLRANMYLQRLSKFRESKVTYVGNGILSRFGMVGKLTELEFKLIWRNKRPKSVLLITILFLGYGLLAFTTNDFVDMKWIYLLFSLIITGMFIMNYGQYLLGWEGSHFDHVLTRNVSFEEYYMSKFTLFTLVSLAAMICSIPYVYFGYEVLLTIFCVFLFNIGINTFVVMFFGSFNPKKIDLTKGTVMNMQGVGAAQFILVIPVMGLPVLFYMLGSFLWGDQVGILLVGAIGVLGLAGTRFWISLLAKWLHNQRYEIAEDFRKG
ncbi:MAG: hypothetical protein HN728_01765 [Flavobacteriales bacterium]|nr:hypothetical protein [Flavobacteriales bacterium]MBT4704467.1 hypothetical protein [Flavobacteriales bacterium]MBT4931222.1 hypothetical protein [Flavobacteriales bacterium]MBT5132001.1 hypothetical protein [Flavobacteriales bacterium]MBT5976595.1 hypothetical protein [Flavobacteriales bacterium]